MEEKVRSICFDLDGTLCEYKFPEIGPPIERIIKLAQVLSYSYRIIVFTCRPWFEYDKVKEWLISVDLEEAQLIMGKPLAVAYIDDRAVEIDYLNSTKQRWDFMEQIEKLENMSKQHRMETAERERRRKPDGRNKS